MVLENLNSLLVKYKSKGLNIKKSKSNKVTIITMTMENKKQKLALLPKCSSLIFIENYFISLPACYFGY